MVLRIKGELTVAKQKCLAASLLGSVAQGGCKLLFKGKLEITILWLVKCCMEESCDFG